MGRLPALKRRAFTAIKTSTIPMHDLDRAITVAAEIGFVTIHARKRSDHILVATIVVRRARETINEVTLAMATSVGLRALERVTECAHTCACSSRAGPVRVFRSGVDRVAIHRPAQWLPQHAVQT